MSQVSGVVWVWWGCGGVGGGGLEYGGGLWCANGGGSESCVNWGDA